MARRIEHRTNSTFDAGTVYRTIIDPDYLRERLVVLGGPNAELAAHDVDGDRVSYRLRHGVAAGNLPSAVRTILGGDLTIDRSETWAPDANRYAGTVKVTIPGMPGDLSGEMRLGDLPEGGSALVVLGKVSVPIPLLGGKVEESVSEQIGQLLDAEHRFAEDWLRSHAG